MTYQLIERIDLSAIAGMYLTEDPSGYAGVRLWCGYCCKLLHFDHRHLGDSPFLTLLVKMADAHRATDCAAPQGPFIALWSPREDRYWDKT